MKPLLSCLAAALLLQTLALQAQDDDTFADIVRASTKILADRQGSSVPIPVHVFQASKGVAILDITKAGVIVGGTGGQGVVLKKTATGWTAPVPVNISGGSFGLQVGGTNTLSIVVLHSDRALKVFTNPGKIGWGAQASGTAGTDTSKHGKDGLLNESDISIYQRIEGFYGGAIFSGTSLSINEDLIKQGYGKDTYPRDLLDGSTPVPSYAQKLVDLLNGKR